MARSNRNSFIEPQYEVELNDTVRSLARPLDNSEDLDPLMDRIGDARFVLLGEASHGTEEYYVWRRRISQRLITEKGFSFIAVEGDWPDCYRVNRYVKRYSNSGANAHQVLYEFQRWPSWMWANDEVVDLAEWLKGYNAALPPERQAGFYGLDVYSLWESMDAVLQYLEPRESEAASAARRAFRCFEPYGYDAEDYARATMWAPASCEEDVVHMLRELRRDAPLFQEDGREAYFNAEQNALVVKSAERYYRTMVRGDADSWNIRDRHMAETLDRLAALHGPHSKAIVWEHNTHVGDARYTDMADAGMVNVGQLARSRYGEQDVVLVGFSSYRGTVIAGDFWGAPMRKMPVPPARHASWEDVLHETLGADSLLIFNSPAQTEDLLEPRGHRAIGVVYRPESEAYGNYVPTVLPRRYDALAYLEESRALHPLHIGGSFEYEVPDTYPVGA
jgi:erythromycin esterase-like protein